MILKASCSSTPSSAGLPYRDPGADAREWEREQGSVALKVQAGEARNPETGKWVKLACRGDRNPA